MRVRFSLALLLPLTVPVGIVVAQTPMPLSRVEIVSPPSGTEIGGVVSIVGSVNVPGMRSYALSFGAGIEPSQWIPLTLGEKGVVNGRLAFWDTTRIPDGMYTLRLRAIGGDGVLQYKDYLVERLLVSNAPRMPTPVGTLPPSPTPTLTPIPTPTSTPVPTLALDDGISAYLYVTQMDQYDPLCPNWRQRYSIWVSNVSMVTVTHVVLTDTLPTGCQPVLGGSTEGATYDGNQAVVWSLGLMRPGEARRFEVLVDVASWLERGKWITSKVVVSCAQVPWVSISEQTLLSDCPWLKETRTPPAFVMPTSGPLATFTPTKAPPSAGRPTLLPSPTPFALSVSKETVSASLDLLTWIIAASLGILLVVTGVLVYRRVVKR